MTKNWLDLQRPDLRGIPMMTAKGWATVFDKADVEVGRTTAVNPPLFDVSFTKGLTVLIRNKKRGQWEGTTTSLDNTTKHFLYLTLNDVIYGKSII